MLKLNVPAPDFTLTDDQGVNFTLSDHLGEKVLLVFYPGDNTPVCTKQLCEYRDGVEAFAGLGVRVVGISKDDAKSHQKFRAKHGLPFTLLSDTKLQVAEKYDSKGMMGMKRSVFLVDEKGIIRYLHVESLALFSRSRDELLAAIAKLESA
jgi:peroxiredoxin